MKKNLCNKFLFDSCKRAFFAIVFFVPFFVFSDGEQFSNEQLVSRCNNAVNSIDNSVTSILSFCDVINTTIDSSSASLTDKQLVKTKTGDIRTFCGFINSQTSNVRSYLSQLDFSVDSNGVASCSWTTNDVSDCLADLNGVASNTVSIAILLNDLYLNQGTLMGLTYTQEGLLRNILSSLNGVSSNVSTLLTSFYDLVSDFSDFKDYFIQNFEGLDFWNLLYTSLNEVQNISLVLDSVSRRVDGQYFFAVYDYSNTNNTANLAYLQSLSNILNRSSLMGFDRFRYYAQGQQLDQNPSLYPLSPYDSFQHAQNASIFDLISSGFSSSLISLGSLNNYLYWINKAVSSNKNETVEKYLSSMSNVLTRIDSYVVEDFSNEFFNLSRYLQTNSLTQTSFSNSFDRLVSSIDTNTFYLVSISNDVSLIRDSITNIYESVTNIQGVTVRIGYSLFDSQQVLSDYDSEGTYFDYLTNRYLTVESENAPSNWFERVETLLAALVFSGTSTTNLTDTFENSNEFEDSLNQIGEDSLFGDEQADIISIAEEAGRSYVSSSYELWHTLTSITKPSSISIGWGNNDSQGFESLVNHEFRVSFSIDEVDGFTELVRSMTTLIWLIITMGIVWKGSFWLCRRIYSLYQLLHSLILSTWGNK